jgi:hypothetical protein
VGKNNNSWNKNDAAGKQVYDRAVVTVVFGALALILLIAFFAVFFTRGRQVKHFAILGAAMVCLIISIGVGIDVAVTSKNDPIRVLYAFNQIITRVKRTPPVMDPYTEQVSAELEANFEQIKREVLVLVKNENMVLTKDSEG